MITTRALARIAIRKRLATMRSEGRVAITSQKAKSKNVRYQVARS